MTADDPTIGRPAGDHRVLEPPGAEPIGATRLDALADLWDGEARLDLEGVVLSRDGHAAWTGRIAADPDVLRGAIAESVAERGGLGQEATDAVLLGRIAAVGARHPAPVTVGERVAVAWPATAVPLFALPDGSWDGGRVVPLRGHAILPAAAVTVPVGDLAPELAAVLAEVAAVPARLADGARVAVLGIDEPAGIVSLAAAVADGRHVTAVVRTLAAARLARALGATGTAIVDLTVASADLLTGTGFDLVVVSDPAAAALAARLGHRVQVLAHPWRREEVAGRIASHAAAAGRAVTVSIDTACPVDRGDAVSDLLASSPVLLAALAWQAGVGPPPAIPTDDAGPENRPADPDESPEAR